MLKQLKLFKSPWYYWHTGYKSIALLSIGCSAAIMALLMLLTTGFSLWGILLAIALDAAAFWLALAYLILRFTNSAWFGLQGYMDAFIIKQLLLPMLCGIFILRLCSFVVARLFKHPSVTNQPLFLTTTRSK